VEGRGEGWVVNMQSTVNKKNTREIDRLGRNNLSQHHFSSCSRDEERQQQEIAKVGDPRGNGRGRLIARGTAKTGTSTGCFQNVPREERGREKGEREREREREGGRGKGNKWARERYKQINRREESIAGSYSSKNILDR